MIDKCNVRFNKNIPCNGRYVESEGCCLRHACLFDVWIAEYDGWKVYNYKNPDADQKRLRGWKRAQFHKWLNSLTLKRAKELIEEGE